MELQVGNRVRHGVFGLGKVLEDQGQGRYSVFFVDAGQKSIDITIVPVTPVQGDEAAHPLLENLADIGQLTSKFRSMKSLTSLFLKKFPGGFEDPGYFKSERSYKVQAHELAVSLLDESRFREFLDRKDFEGIAKDALRLVAKTNLIFPNEKMSLTDGLKAGPERQEMFANALLALLYEDTAFDDRFKRFIRALEELDAGKWTIVTYFPFLRFPETYPFLKPAVTQDAARTFGFNLEYRPEPNWKTYRRLMDFTEYLRKELTATDQRLEPRDVIDIQSFIWCSVKIAEGKY
jgi:hypothetical protein